MHNAIPVGQNRQYFTKALLIYDGIHYDPLVYHTNSSEVTIFTVDDEQVASLAMKMAREAQQVSNSMICSGYNMYCGVWDRYNNYSIAVVMLL